MKESPRQVGCRRRKCAEAVDARARRMDDSIVNVEVKSWKHNG
jgi:hypothetical protein